MECGVQDLFGLTAKIGTSIACANRGHDYGHEQISEKTKINQIDR
jgi:hypothetical protein